MNVLRAMHNRLIRIPWWRRYQRRLSRRLKNALGCPDAYGDLFAIAQATRPAAIVDIGSFTGDTIARFVDEVSIPICGFEPTRESFLALQRRFGGNPQVRLFNCALSDRNGDETLFCNENPQTNSLLDNDQGNAVSFPDDTRHVDTIQVKVQTLDAWVARHLPDGKILIKADVQGAEGRLLDGGQATFHDRVTALYAEAQICPMYKGQTTFCELHERLTKEYGFYLHNVYACLRDKHGKAVQVDALWIKDPLVSGPGRQNRCNPLISGVSGVKSSALFTERLRHEGEIMKIIALTASPRGEKSQTLQLTRALLDGAREAGADISLIDICKLNIKYCTACQLCYREGRCVHDDDFSQVYQDILAADGIVLASPDYFRSVSAQLKTVIDRMSDAIHCQLLTGKYACSVATSGGPAWAEVTTYLSEVMSSFGAWITGHVGASQSAVPEAFEKALADAANVGKDLAKAIREKRRYPDQEPRLAGSRQFFMGLVKSMQDAWPHEADVWQRQGWS